MDLLNRRISIETFHARSVPVSFSRYTPEQTRAELPGRSRRGTLVPKVNDKVEDRRESMIHHLKEDADISGMWSLAFAGGCLSSISKPMFDDMQTR